MEGTSTTSLTGQVLAVEARAVDARGDRASLVAVGVIGLAVGTMFGGAVLAAARPPAQTRARAALAAPPAPAVHAAAPSVADEVAPAAMDDDDDAIAPSDVVPQHARAPRHTAPSPSPSHTGSSSEPLRITAPGVVTGYDDGHPITVTITMVDGKPVERHTADAFRRMQAAADRQGVHIRIVSAFRTMEHQRQLYADWRAGRGNLAAVPGHSNHQSGHALDLNVTAPGVGAWLAAHAASYGFRRTVPSESWHWEHW